MRLATDLAWRKERVRNWKVPCKEYKGVGTMVTVRVRRHNPDRGCGAAAAYRIKDQE